MTKREVERRREEEKEIGWEREKKRWLWASLKCINYKTRVNSSGTDQHRTGDKMTLGSMHNWKWIYFLLLIFNSLLFPSLPHYISLTSNLFLSIFLYLSLSHSRTFFNFLFLSLPISASLSRLYLSCMLNQQCSLMKAHLRRAVGTLSSSPCLSFSTRNECCCYVRLHDSLGDF